MTLDVLALRKQFPILDQTIGNHPLVYLDNAATNQKPQSVIDAISDYYQKDNANVHRGVHTLSMRATDQYEAVRETVKTFLSASKDYEVIFVRGTTEAINLVAQSYARPSFEPGDEILITAMEHHSNIVPWQMVCEQTGAVLKVVPIHASGDIDLDAFKSMLNSKVKLLSMMHVSNAIGTVNPIEECIALAKSQDIPVLIDGAQAVPHAKVNLTKLDCDFYAFSSHKCYGPTGVGVLVAKRSKLEAMSPYQGGGDMIKMVTFEKTTYNDLPYKFEAGTPNMAGVIGLGAALKFMQAVGVEEIAAHEDALLEATISGLQSQSGIRLIASPKHRAGAVSFVFDDIHPHDVGTILDGQGVAVRTGHHCAMPLMTFYKVPATVRVSFSVYNTLDEIELLLKSLHKVKEVFSR